MTSYTISITPDDTSRASTTLRVDVSDNAPRITELLVRAGAATGLSAHQLPAVDLDLLLRAVTPAAVPALVHAAETERPAPAEPEPAEPQAPQPRAEAAAVPARASGRAAAATAAPRKRTTRKPAEPTAASTGRSTAGRTAKQAGGAKKAAKATRTAAGKATPTTSGGERAYRRAPDDLPQAFQQAGGVTAVARHYGVPRHTAQSWVRRLRQQGLISGGR
jgi:hypothetical protein